MRLVTYNIQYGVGRDGICDLGRIAQAVDGADVIALQEVVRNMPMTGTGDPPAELAALLPGYYWVYGAGVDLDCSERRLQVAELLRLHRDGPMSGAAADGPDNWADRNGLKSPPVPETAVIMGDFNFEPSHPEYELMTGEVDPVYGRITTFDGFADAWVRANHDEDQGVTCPRCAQNDTHHDTHHDMRIDYIYVSGNLAGRVRTARIDEHAQGSDHQPVWVELEL